MKVTIRKAAQFTKDLNNMIDTKWEVQLNAKDFQDTWEQELETIDANTKAKIQEDLELSKHVYDLRMLIQEENLKSGISRSLNVIARLQMQLRIVNDCLDDLARPMRKDVLQKKLDRFVKAEEQETSSFRDLHSSIMVSPDTLREHLEDLQKKLKKQIRREEDIVSEMNSSNYIEIPPDIYDTMVRLDLL